MSISIRPPLLNLGGELNFPAYEREFNRMYRFGFVTDVLGNQVVFERSACWHVCFEPKEKDQYSRRKRNVWSQERAEHISWIMAALTDAGTEVRPNDQDPDNRLNYLLDVDADPENGWAREFFCVVVEKTESKTVAFITAFPIDQKYWAKCRRAGRTLYPVAK
jgi:hypothetical protein